MSDGKYREPAVSSRESGATWLGRLLLLGASADARTTRKNTKELSAYYCGLLSFIPIVGILFGIPAVILGVQGLRRRLAHPEAEGGTYS